MAKDLLRGTSTERSWARGGVSGSFATDEAMSYAKSKVPWKGVLISLGAAIGFMLLPAKKTERRTA